MRFPRLIVRSSFNFCRSYNRYNQYNLKGKGDDLVEREFPEKILPRSRFGLIWSRVQSE